MSQDKKAGEVAVPRCTHCGHLLLRCSCTDNKVKK